MDFMADQLADGRSVRTLNVLDYFNLKSLSQLPTLQELRDIESINAELDLEENSDGTEQSGEQAADDQHEPSEAAAELQPVDDAAAPQAEDTIH